MEVFQKLIVVLVAWLFKWVNFMIWKVYPNKLLKIILKIVKVGCPKGEKIEFSLYYKFAIVPTGLPGTRDCHWPENEEASWTQSMLLKPGLTIF